MTLNKCESINNQLISDVRPLKLIRIFANRSPHTAEGVRTSHHTSQHQLHLHLHCHGRKSGSKNFMDGRWGRDDR